ncbi:hypothetical protein AOLI_G00099450 [Acnodon oligacanthus]
MWEELVLCSHRDRPAPEPSCPARPSQSKREAAGRLRGRGPGKARRMRGAGAPGPAGEVMGSTIVPAAWGWRGEGLGRGAREEAKGRGLLNYLCSL